MSEMETARVRDVNEAEAAFADRLRVAEEAPAAARAESRNAAAAAAQAEDAAVAKHITAWQTTFAERERRLVDEMETMTAAHAEEMTREGGGARRGDARRTGARRKRR